MLISTENGSGFVAEYHVSSWSCSNLPSVDKNPTNNVYDVCSVVGLLMDVGSLYQHQPIVFEWFPLVRPNVWKVVDDVISHSWSSHSFVFLGCPELHNNLWSWLFLSRSTFANFKQLPCHFNRGDHLYDSLTNLLLWSLIYSPSYCSKTVCNYANYVSETSLVQKTYHLTP